MSTKSEPSSMRRTRVPTLESLQYRQDIAKKKLRQTYKELVTKTEVIKSRFIELTSYKERQLLYGHWLTLYENFLDAYDDVARLLPDHEQENDKETWFKPRHIELNVFADHLKFWVSDNKHNGDQPKSTELETKPLIHRPASDIMGIVDDAKSHRSRSSKGSIRTHSSVSSALFIAKLKEQQHKAELLVKTEAMKKIRSIEEAKLQLQLEEEELNINSELAMVEVREKVVDNFETSSRDGIQSLTREHTSKILLDPDAQEFQPQNMTQDIDGHASAASTVITADILLSMVHNLKKPVMDIKKFDGNPTEYKRFLRQFETKVSVHCDNDDERMNFLEQYTMGEPHKIVCGLSYLDASVGYAKALEEMNDRYGDFEVIVNAYIKRALSWPVIKAGNPKALDELSLFLQECHNAVQSMEAMRVLEYSDNFRRLVGKLPYHIHDRWRSIVQGKKDAGSTVRFKHLVDFVTRESKKANDPTFDKIALDVKPNDPPHRLSNKASFANNATENRSRQNVNTVNTYRGYSTISSDASTRPKIHMTPDTSAKVVVTPLASRTPCVHCGDKNHPLSSCKRFSDILFSDRITFLRGKDLCFGCLRYGHIKVDCRKKLRCDKCQMSHPTILHIVRDSSRMVPNVSSEELKSPVDGVGAQCQTGAGEGVCTMAIIPVKVRLKGGVKVTTTYAFLDSGSNTSFCTNNVARQIGACGRKVNLHLDTMGTSQKLAALKIDGIEIGNIDDGPFIKLPSTYTKEHMPVSSKHIPTDSDISCWSHLQDIHLPQIDAEIGLLIGNNVPDAYIPLELRTGSSGSPFGARSRLGWIVWGVVRPSPDIDHFVNQTEVCAIQASEELRS